MTYQCNKCKKPYNTRDGIQYANHSINLNFSPIDNLQRAIKSGMDLDSFNAADRIINGNYCESCSSLLLSDRGYGDCKCCGAFTFILNTVETICHSCSELKEIKRNDYNRKYSKYIQEKKHIEELEKERQELEKTFYGRVFLSLNNRKTLRLIPIIFLAFVILIITLLLLQGFIEN